MYVGGGVLLASSRCVLRKFGYPQKTRVLSFGTSPIGAYIKAIVPKTADLNERDHVVCQVYIQNY